MTIKRAIFQCLWICLFLSVPLLSVGQNTEQEKLEWKEKLENVINELSKIYPGKHLPIKEVTVESTFLGDISNACSANSFVLARKSFTKEIFIKKIKTKDIWANDRLKVNIYECANREDAKSLIAALDIFAEFRYKGRKDECAAKVPNPEYTIVCCDAIHNRGRYLQFQYQNVVIVLVDNSGSNPTFKNIKDDFKAYFEELPPLTTPKAH